VMESTFTIGFPDDLSVITAHPHQTLTQSTARLPHLPHPFMTFLPPFS
jgi:hypothetical protein